MISTSLTQWVTTMYTKIDIFIYILFTYVYTSSEDIIIRAESEVKSSMPLRFLTRLTKGAGHYHMFYVPKYVKEFYGLKSGSYKGGVTLRSGATASYRIHLSMYRSTLRGRVPESAGFLKSIAEIWMYPHTWMPPAKRPNHVEAIASEWPMQTVEYLDTFSPNYRSR